MLLPTPVEHHTLVRLLREQIDSVEYSRYVDGSAYAVGRQLERGYEGHQNAWRSTLDYLTSLGFVELSVARAQGTVPAV